MTMGIRKAVRHGAGFGLFLVLASLLKPTVAQGQSPSQAPGTDNEGIESLGWISGCWLQERGARRTVERWGGTSDVLLGTSQSTSEGRTVAWEFLRISAGESGTVTYYAHPSGQAPASFEAKLVTGDSVVFANPAHDFPQTITYRRRPDSLLASIGGTTSSGERQIFFPYARISCESDQ